MFLRSIWATMITVAILNKNIKTMVIDSVPRASIGTLAFRCFQGSVTNTINYVSSKHLPLGIVGVVNSMAPLITVTLAFFFLKERLKPTEFGFLLCAFAGCIAIVLGGSADGGSYASI
jgi:drug/metabolite transporter (DMT)-like permease